MTLILTCVLSMYDCAHAECSLKSLDDKHGFCLSFSPVSACISFDASTAAQWHVLISATTPERGCPTDVPWRPHGHGHSPVLSTKAKSAGNSSSLTKTRRSRAAELQGNKHVRGISKLTKNDLMVIGDYFQRAPPRQLMTHCPLVQWPDCIGDKAVS